MRNPKDASAVQGKTILEASHHSGGASDPVIVQGQHSGHAAEESAEVEFVQIPMVDNPKAYLLALAHLNTLHDRDNPKDAYEIALLAAVIERYEASAAAQPNDTAHAAPKDPVAAIRAYMDRHALTQAKLAERVGLPRSRISEILSGKRALSKSMVVKFTRLGLPAADLIASAEVTEPARAAARQQRSARKPQTAGARNSRRVTPKILAATVKHFMAKNGLSQNDMAALTGLGVNTIRAVMSGSAHYVRPVLMARIASAIQNYQAGQDRTTVQDDPQDASQTAVRFAQSHD